MSMIPRTALRASRLPIARPATFRRTFADTKTEQAEGAQVLKKGARRDPELIILLTIMTGAFALAGWHFSQNPTTNNGEGRVAKAPNSEPWHTGGNAAYQYHPGGDPSKGKKDAPSALNEVIIPNVNLPRELHEKYNKWGKEGY